MDKKNKISFIVNLIGIGIYALTTIYLVASLISEVMKQSGNENNLIGLFVLIIIIFGSIGYGVATIINIVSLILAVAAKEKKVSRIVMSVVFMLLPVITEIGLILVVKVLSNNA